MTAGSPAAGVGMRQGDLITALDGRPVISTQQFIETIDSYAPGQSVTLTVTRGSRKLTIRVKLGTRPQTLPSG